MTDRSQMTATQIAAENRRARQARQADLDVERGVAGGPFDQAVDLDADAPPDTVPSLAEALDLPPSIDGVDVDMPDGAVDVKVELRARLDAVTAPPAVEAGRFAAGPVPRIVDGLIVPAKSVADNRLATWVLIPVAEVGTIGLTGRAVGVSPKVGRWLAVWIGDDRVERDRVLEVFAAEYAEARRPRR